MGVEFRLRRNDHNKVEDFVSRRPEGTTGFTIDANEIRHQAAAAEAARSNGYDVLVEPLTERLVVGGFEPDGLPYCRPGDIVLNWLVDADFDGGGVGDPALVAGDSPVALQVVDALVEVVGGEVDGGLLAGAAHGHVGEFSAAASGEDVGPLVGGALGSVHGEGVAVVEVVVDGLAGQGDGPSVAGLDDERGRGRPRQ